MLERTPIFSINNYFDEYNTFHVKNTSLLNFHKEESKYEIINLDTKSKKSKFFDYFIYFL